MGLEDVTRAGVVTPVRVDPTGGRGPTRKAVRGPRWRRVGRGWYVDSGADSGCLDQRIIEAMAGMPEEAAVTGWAALAWQQARWFSGRRGDGQLLPVPVALPDNRITRQRHGAAPTEDWLFDDDVMTVDGLRITVPHRSVTYETRRARSLVQAVRVIDMAAYDDLVDLEALEAYVGRLICRQGVRLTRKAVPLADENVWSPMETDLRLCWRAVFPEAPLLCNPPVFDSSGRHLFTPDVLDPEAGVAGEYHGRVHEQDGNRRRDLDKDAAYRDHGIELAEMMSGDRRDTHSFEVRLRAAYDRARRRTPSSSWTLDQPAWWVDTSTVARRRALTAE